MEYINAKKSNSSFSPFLLILVLFAIVMVIIVIINGFEFNLSVLIFFAFIFVPPILFFLDIFLWHVVGKEIIYTQDEKLIIKKVNRVRPRKKKIRFDKIEDIYLWETKGFLNDTYSLMSAFWDWNKQGKICIKYDNGNKYYIGRNLNETEAERLLKTLKSELPSIVANSTLKSKITEWILFFLVILVIVFIAIRLM